VLPIHDFVQRHVVLFNEGVRSGDFGRMLAHFSATAEMRFENVPNVGVLEFHGIDAIEKAYAAQPPDDEIDLTADPHEEEGTITAPFRWRRDGAAGTLYLHRDEDRIDHLRIVFA
jgi:hypothetical protein